MTSRPAARLTRRALSAAVAAAAALGLVATASTATAASSTPPGTAGATTVTGYVESARPAFYNPPENINYAPGTVLRTESANALLDPLGLGQLTTNAQRVMYVSRDRLNRPIAVTGLVLTPTRPWIGFTPRPLIGYAAGTQGMNDRCAPTRMVSGAFEYEALFYQSMLDKGYSVAITDYQGLGTPGSHTYMNRQVQGQAVLDMVRAAQKINTGRQVNAKSPVGLSGYSQGGGATAAAAELASTYAPELKIKGALAGAVPADLGKVGENLDGTVWNAFLDFAVVGLAAGYDINIYPYLNDKGAAMLKSVEDSCVVDFLRFANQKSSSMTKDGKPITAYFNEEPFKSVLADNKIGNRKPSMPVLVTHSTLDDTIPYAVGKQLAKDWCAKGANVRFSPNAAPLHVGGMIPNTLEAQTFFAARFAGLPQLSNCWTL